MRSKERLSLPTLTLLALLPLLVCACGGAPETDALTTTEAAVRATATVRGRVFYNDRRTHGLFSARRTPAGLPGTRCPASGLRDDGTACSENWLGAQYAVADVIDICSLAVLTSVSVGYDGAYAATFSPGACPVKVKVRLRYCGDWCFSLNQSASDPYALYHPGASSSAPLLVRAGQDLSLTDLHFNPAGSAPGTPNDTSIAANYYASLVDTILTFHRDAGVPFYKAEFGEIQYIYPSSASSTATTKSASQVVISTFEGGWPSGHTSAHEYGHVLMLRAWDGDYGFDGIGISANDSEIAPSRQIAFKEAWAEFTARAVFAETEGCDRPSFDDNATKPLPGALGNGTQWRLNVTKALCDWYDARHDDDASLAGAGDHFAASGLYSMWYNLRRMDLDVSAYGGNASHDGLYFCDWVDYYVTVRSPGSTALVADLVYNENIACYLPTP